MKTKLALKVQYAGKTSKGAPYYFIHAKDNDPALVKFLELQNEYLTANGMEPLAKNTKSGLYPFYSSGKKLEFRNFGNNGFIELVEIEGREMFLPDLTNIKRIHSDADDIIASTGLTGTRALLEKGKLVLELIAERTGDTYVYPTTKVSAPVADDNLDMEDFSS
jgi:hypothetical protein